MEQTSIFFGLGASLHWHNEEACTLDICVSGRKGSGQILLDVVHLAARSPLAGSQGALQSGAG